MAQYARQYNDIFDDYVIEKTYGNAAPRRAPQQRPVQRPQPPGGPPKPPVHKYKKSKEQVIRENQRKFKIALAKFSVVFALFAVMIAMAFAGRIEVRNAAAELEAAEQTYQLCLEENNALKQELNAFMADKDIDDIAVNVLGLVKVTKNKSKGIDISEYQ